MNIESIIFSGKNVSKVSAKTSRKEYAMRLKRAFNIDSVCPTQIKTFTDYKSKEITKIVSSKNFSSIEEMRRAITQG